MAQDKLEHGKFSSPRIRPTITDKIKEMKIFTDKFISKTPLCKIYFLRNMNDK